MKKGFTLIELMMAMSVLAIIVSVALPSIQKQRHKHYEKVSSIVIEKNYEVYGSVINRAGYTDYVLVVENTYKHPDGRTYKDTVYEIVDMRDYDRYEINSEWVGRR